MKQKKFGKKIQNWHRPLGRDQLTRRYLQNRDADPEFENVKTDRHFDSEIFDFGEMDDDWSICSPRQYKLTKLLTDLNSKTYLFDVWPAESQDDLSPDRQSEDINSPVEQVHDPEFFMEYIHGVLDYYVDPILIENAAANIDDIKVLNKIGRELENSTFTRLIILFSPVWLRRPSNWQGGSDRSLIEHLFVKYEVPEFLYHTWFAKPDIINVKWICWFLILAQGGSLRKAGEYRLKNIQDLSASERRERNYYRWYLANGFQRQLYDLPERVTPLVACIMAEVKRLGGVRKDYLRLLKNHAFIVDVTGFYQQPGSELRPEPRFWRESVRWLIKYRDEISDQEAQSILVWARHEFIENYDFSLRGRSVRTSLQRAVEYEESLSKPWEPYEWEGLGLDSKVDIGKVKWSIKELKSARELYEEGRSMHHCVYRYVHQCVDKAKAIFSLKRNGKRSLTVAVDVETGDIVQALGRFNRKARIKELKN